MADARIKVAGNADGAFFVDETCIDCGACRWIAPQHFGRNDQIGLSVVTNQPRGPAIVSATRAMVACPTASIGAERPQLESPLPAVSKLFPQQVLPNVYFCGYTSEASFGAASWLILRPEGNVMIDAPRWSTLLAKEIALLGGVARILLTHRDDVADHAKYAAHFGARRLIAKIEVNADTDSVEEQVVVKEKGVLELDHDLRAIATPGHTEGSLCFLWRDCLFTGDHLAYSARLGHLYAFRSACWHSWPKLIESLELLLELEFSSVLPGHGAPFYGSVTSARKQLETCIAWAKGK